MAHVDDGAKDSRDPVGAGWWRRVKREPMGLMEISTREKSRSALPMLFRIVEIVESLPGRLARAPTPDIEVLWSFQDEGRAELAKALFGYSVHIAGDHSRTLITGMAVLDNIPQAIYVDCNARRALGNVRPEDDEKVVVVVDIDTFPSIGEAVDTLIAFRLAHPQVIVLIGSSEFSRDDLSHERFVIADASIRLPATRAAIASGLCAAVANKSGQRHIC